MAEGLGVCRYLILKVMLVVGLLLVTCSGLSAQESTLKGLDTQKSLKVLLPQNSKPLSYRHEGEVKGLFVDMLKRVADAHGIKLNIDLVPYARAHQIMNSKKADVASVHGVTNRGLHGEVHDSVYLIYTKDLWASFFALEDSDIEIQQENDLWRYRIGMPRLIAQRQVQRKGIEFFKSPNHLVKALKAGRVDMVLLAESVGPYFEKIYDIRLKRVWRHLPYKDAFWFSDLSLGSNAKAYCHIFARGLNELSEAGELTKLVNVNNAERFGLLLRSVASDEPFVCVGSL